MGARTPLFLVRPGAKLVRMAPSAPEKEDDLQQLIAEYPELIGDDDTGLLLIEREHGIADAADGSPRWSLDHLFVTRTATPVLVEVKRAVDTRLRREVVGQLLDYAANSVAYWPAGAIAARFEAACEKRGADPAEVLEEFLRGGMAPGEFWAQVDANFRGGRIKLVFVADEIPSELARIVEFLNDQMEADVCAVELRYFEGSNGERTLAPRVIGETERSRAQKSGSRPKLDPISQEECIAKHIAPLGPKVLQGARALLDIVSASGADTGVASTQGSIYATLRTVLGRSAYPFLVLKNGTAQIGFGWVGAAPVLSTEEARRAYYDRFAAAVGPLSAKWHPKGFPSFPLERLANPAQLAAFREVADDFLAACRAELPPDR